MSKKKSPVNPLGIQNSKVFYYPALDGLRFVAFFIVFLHHALPYPGNEPSLVNTILMAIKKNGWIGVELFFVLSGFLITSLLLKERHLLGKFSFKNFYIRRALRIWPLYFLALLTGFVLFPYIYLLLNGKTTMEPRFVKEIIEQFPYYLLFLGNWAVIRWDYSSFPNIAHLWTISIEEQFYIIWPLVLYFITNLKKGLIAGGLVILFSILVRYSLAINNVHHPNIYVNTFARVDILVLGAITALIYHYKQPIIYKSLIFRKIYKYFFSLPMQIFLLIILSYILYRVSFFSLSLIRNIVFGYLLTGLFMVYFLISALRTGSFFTKLLSWPIFVWLGKVSYGLYVWHKLGIEICNYLLKNTPLATLSPIIAFILTIIFGYLSYNFFEAKFLKLKDKFTSITSRSI